VRGGSLKMRKKRVSAVAGLCGGQEVGEMEKSGGGERLVCLFFATVGDCEQRLG